MLQIEDLDPFDDERMAEHHAVYAAADQHGRRYSNGWALAEMTAGLRAPSTYVRHLSTTARVDGVAVAVGDVELPQKDNTTSAEVSVHVHPDWQRRGIGTRLARHVCEQARANGRTVMGA